MIKRKNDLILRKDYAIIKIKHCIIKIDLDDIDRCKNIKWSLTKDGYVWNGKIKSTLHAFIMKSKWIDHINHDKLDNRKSNLRKCTNQQNLFNSKLRKDNTSGIKGVYKRKYKNKIFWIAFIRINQIGKYLGCFVNKDKAIEVRKEAEQKYFGDFICSD